MVWPRSQTSKTRIASRTMQDQRGALEGPSVLKVYPAPAPWYDPATGPRVAALWRQGSGYGRVYPKGGRSARGLELRHRAPGASAPPLDPGRALRGVAAADLDHAE